MSQAIVDALIAGWNDGNLDGLDAALDANYVRKAPAALNSDAASLAEFKEVVTKFRGAFPDAHVTIDEVHYIDNRAFFRWTFTGTNTGPGDFPVTGKAVSVSGSTHCRFSGGKLTEELVFFDSLDMLIQLGLAEAPS